MTFRNLLPLAFLAAGSLASFAQDDPGMRSLRLFEEVIFYDGYQPEIIDADVVDGVLRHSNSLYAVKLTEEQLSWFGSDLIMDVVIGARCDNYDRIGNVNVAFVPKGSETYDPKTTTRIELARFITPFMDKNKQPDEVPYRFSLDAVSYILRDSKWRQDYDIWVELEVFGVPYAANEQIKGCKGRNDTFDGTLTFSSITDPAPLISNDVFVPISMQLYMTNYTEEGTDELGNCIKTWEFEVPEDCTDSRLTLVMSNHGANQGGEEYIRRLHRVTFDGKNPKFFTPGGVSCEPYRVYNTQANGIYGSSRSDESWESGSNWCPGGPIPVREFDLGPMAKGKHSVTIKVSRTEFVGGEGYFPVSMYFQGLTEGTLPAGIYTPQALEPGVTLTVTADRLTWQCDHEVREVVLYSLAGSILQIAAGNAKEMNVNGYPHGVYLVSVICGDGSSAVRKIML